MSTFISVAANVRKEISHDTRLLPTGRAVLLALAIRADEALNSPQGYSGSWVSEVAVDAGVSTGTAEKYLREAEKHGRVTKTSVGGWRVTERLIQS